VTLWVDAFNEAARWTVSVTNDGKPCPQPLPAQSAMIARKRTLEALPAADQALYRAKKAGRNRVETSSLAAESVPLRLPDDLSIYKRSAA
jgi:hypothetical protein